MDRQAWVPPAVDSRGLGSQTKRRRGLIAGGLLMGGTGLLYPERLRAMHRIETTTLSWPGVTTRIHRFGRMKFNLGRREIGHLHGSRLLDIPFTRPLRDEAVKAG